MTIDHVTRLRTLAQNARDGGQRAKEPEMKKQYDDIARHYDQMIETIVAGRAKKHQTPT